MKCCDLLLQVVFHQSVTVKLMIIILCSNIFDAIESNADLIIIPNSTCNSLKSFIHNDDPILISANNLFKTRKFNIFRF